MGSCNREVGFWKGAKLQWQGVIFVGLWVIWLERIRVSFDDYYSSFHELWDRVAFLWIMDRKLLEILLDSQSKSFIESKNLLFLYVRVFSFMYFFSLYLI